MKRFDRPTRWLSIALLVVLGLMPHARTGESQEVRVTVGLFAPSAPFSGPDERLAYVTALADHLASKTGRAVVGRVFARAGDFTAAVKKGEVQFAVIDAPYAASAGLPYKALGAAVRGSGATVTWELVAGSGVRTLADLKGKHVVVPSVGGREAPFVLNALLEGEVPGDYFGKISGALDSISALSSVNLGRADAAVVPAGLKLSAGQHRVAELRTVGWPMFAAMPGVDEASASRFADALGSFRTATVFASFSAAGSGEYGDLARSFGSAAKRGPLAVPPPARLEVKGVLTGRSFVIKDSDVAWAISAPARDGSRVPVYCSAVKESFFQELKRYVGFVDEDEAALRGLAAALDGERRAITERFYVRLAQHDQARLVFSGPEQVERLKGTLVQWMEELVTGPWDEAYYVKRARIGRMHVVVGLPQRYMFGAMNQLREELIAVADRALADERRRFLVVERALNRVLDLELAIMLETYAEAQNERLQRLERQRSERLSAMGTLAAGLAHEIRNPLNAAHLQLALLQRRLARREPSDVEAAQVAATVVSAEMQRLASLVDEFLQFARPQPPHTSRIDVRDTAASVVGLITPEAVAAGVDVILEPGPPVLLRADDERLKQVVLNLVHNAMESTGPGGHVVVRVGRRPEGVYLEVHDDGPGLSSPDLPVFEPFFTTKPDGTGLGLAIVERIVNDHGGTVRVDSVRGRTCFTVVLPSPE